MRDMSNRVEPLAAHTRTTDSVQWSAGLPVLSTPTLTLRELRRTDARSLSRWLRNGANWSFTAQPPESPAAFERFVDGVEQDRRAGRTLCFGIVPHGLQDAVGFVHIRRLDVSFHSCRCGLAFGDPFYETGVVAAAAEAAADYAFRQLGPGRLEVRTADPREGQVFERLGAVREGVLRESWLRPGGDAADETIWSILREEWLASGRRRVCQPSPAPGRLLLGPRRAAGGADDAIVLRPGWSARLPVLSGDGVTLREIEPGDAPHLLGVLSPAEIREWFDPPPQTDAEFRRFAAWSAGEREAGRGMCFVIVASPATAPCGLVQVHQVDPKFFTAEWGIVLGAGQRGTGVFPRTTRLLLDFLFETVGIHRLEAQTTRLNLAGSGSLRGSGGVREALLRRASTADGRAVDRELWGILRPDWQRARATA